MSYGAPPPPPPPPPVGGANVSPVGELALWPQRALGGVIDVALFLPGYIVAFIGTPKVDANGQIGSFSVLYFIGWAYMLAIYIWNRWMKGGQGQTIGRGVAGVTLVDAQGQPLGTGKAFVRDIAHIVDSIICYVGWLFPFWDAKRQTLADKIMNTYVVTVPK